ncbi:hypothetical protein N665_0721s0014 [Sinapis alba]|nr:hypothetical protein N665_0721s0014 [Sinapis alba]
MEADHISNSRVFSPHNSMFRNLNITLRILERRIRNPPPGACVNRRFFENILPRSNLIADQAGLTENILPNATLPASPKELNFLKISDNGKYLVSFHEKYDLQKSVIIFKVSLCSFFSGSLHRASSFSSYATFSSSTTIVDQNNYVDENMCGDFFIHVPAQDLGVFASYTGNPEEWDPEEWEQLQLNDRFSHSTRKGVFPCISFHLIRLCDGEIIDCLKFHNDNISLYNNEGVHLCDNILALTSSRHQRVNLYEIGFAGFIHICSMQFKCIDEQKLFAREVDGLYVVRAPRSQLIDIDQVFVKFGSDTSGVANELHVIYDMSTGEAVPFYKNQSSYEFFHNFGDFFNLQLTSFSHISSSSPTRHTEKTAKYLRSIRNDKSLFSRTVEHLLKDFPFECQIRTPSPYLDPYLFQFDENVPKIEKAFQGGWDREYDGEVAKFKSLRHPQKQNFNILAGEYNQEYHLGKAKVLIHPNLPLVISFLDGGLMHQDSINIQRP